MTPYIAVYATVAFLVCAVGVIKATDPYETRRRVTRRWARVALLAPVWPLALPYGLYLLVKHLWWLADWRNTR